MKKKTDTLQESFNKRMANRKRGSKTYGKRYGKFNTQQPFHMDKSESDFARVRDLPIINP